MPVGDGKVQQTSGVEIFSKLAGDIRNELVDPLDRVQHRFPQHGMAESPVRGIGTGIVPGLLHAVQKQGKRPLAISPSLDSVEPFCVDGQGQRTLDVLPASNVAVVHPHQGSIEERMAVAIGQRSLGRCSQVGKYERRGGFGGQPFQIDAVPRRDRRGEDARLGAQGWSGIVANSETVAIVRPSHVLKARSEKKAFVANQQRGAGGERTSRRRQSYDWVRMECWGWRINLDSKISSLPLYT